MATGMGMLWVQIWISTLVPVGLPVQFPRWINEVKLLTDNEQEDLDEDLHLLWLILAKVSLF